MGRTVYYDYKGNMIDPPKADPIKPTNADRIRAMTDEELARWIADTANDAVNKGLRVKGFLEVRHTTRQWLDWLRQEADREAE